MKILRAPSELNAAGRPVCVAIGVFDGVHIGHQEIIRQTVQDARRQGGLSVAITFDPHPAAIVAPSRMPPLIYPLGRRLQAIADLGADAVLLLRFDEAMGRLSGEEFIGALREGFGRLASIWVGSDFTFGWQRSGHVALLTSLGQQHGFVAHGLERVQLEGRVVSSTYIRETIHRGAFEEARRFLGRRYSLCGSVTRGDQLGRQLGFPTANLAVAGLVLPPHGVYAARALHAAGCHPAALNIGLRPTLNQAQPTLRVEAHLLDFAGDLYGADLELVLVKPIRPEQKFPSLEALRQAVQHDVAAVREACLAEAPSPA